MDDAKEKLYGWILFITAFFFMVIISWFSGANINYETGILFPFETAGWFILGFPFILLFSFFYAGFFYIIRNLIGIRKILIFMLISSFLLLSFTVYYALPSSYIKMIVGKDAAMMVKIENFQGRDSFNDGMTFYGILKVSKDFFYIMAKEKSVRKQENWSLGLFKSLFKDNSISEKTVTDMYGNDHGSFCYDSQNDRVYFIYRTRVK